MTILGTDITGEDIRKALRATFSLYGNYSDVERAIFSAFTGTSFSVVDGEIKYLYKNLTGGKHSALKDIDQSINKGMFKPKTDAVVISDKQKEINDLCDDFCDKIVARIEESIIGKTKGALGKEKKVALENMDSEIVGNDKYFECVINQDSQYKNFIDTSDIQTYDGISQRDYLPDIYLSRKVIGYLAAFLALEEGQIGDAVKDEELFDGALIYLRKCLESELKKVGEICDKNNFVPCDVCAIRKAACILADGHIDELAAAEGTHTMKFFVDYMRAEAIETLGPNDFKDLPLGGFEGGSNYNFAFINDVASREEYYDIENCASQAEAESILESADNVEDCLKAFKFFDKQMLQGEIDQVVDNFEEGAWICLANLVIAEKIKNAETKATIMELFGVPLARCFDRIDDVKSVVEKAKAKVESLDIGVKIDVVENSKDEATDAITDGDVDATTDDADTIKEEKKSKISVKAEMTSFRKKLVKAIRALEKKQGLYKKRAAKKDNPQRASSVYVQTVLGVSELGLNKNFNNFGQSLSDLLLELPVEEKSVASVPIVLEKIYGELYSRGQQLRDETSGMEFTTEEKNAIREKYGLTNDGAKELIEKIYGEHFDDKGMLI